MSDEQCEEASKIPSHAEKTLKLILKEPAKAGNRCTSRESSFYGFSAIAIDNAISIATRGLCELGDVRVNSSEK